MPRRRLAGLAMALLAPVVLAGCEIKLKPDSVPMPFSQAPVPAASTSQPGYVCTAVYRILTSGAARLTSYVGDHSDTDRQNMQTTLAGMAADVTAEGAKATDAPLQRAITDIASDLSAASRQPDPAAYVNGGFTTVAQKLDGLC